MLARCDADAIRLCEAGQKACGTRDGAVPGVGLGREVQPSGVEGQ